MQNLKAFWEKNKVFIVGIVSAILMSIYEITSKGDKSSTWVFAWSGAIAVLTFLSRNSRGQYVTIFSTVLASTVAFFNLHNSPEALTFKQIANEMILPLGIQLLGMVAPPPKSREYEHSTPIVEAKVEAKAMQEAKKEEANKPDEKPPIKYSSPEQK